jgi:hypothetical protein
MKFANAMSGRSQWLEFRSGSAEASIRTSFSLEDANERLRWTFRSSSKSAAKRRNPYGA